MSTLEDDPDIEYEHLPQGEHPSIRLGRPVLELIGSLRDQLPEELGRSWVTFFKDDGIRYEVDLRDLNLEPGDTDGTFRAEIYGTLESTPEGTSTRNKILILSGGALAIGTVLGLVYYSQIRSRKQEDNE